MMPLLGAEWIIRRYETSSCSVHLLNEYFYTLTRTTFGLNGFFSGLLVIIPIVLAPSFAHRAIARKKMKKKR